MSGDLKRRGRCLVDRTAYEAMAGATRRAFEKRILVHRADLTADGKNFIIHATSPLFEAVEDGQPSPFYLLIFYQDADRDQVTISAKRDDAFTAQHDARPPAIAESFEVKATVSTAEKRKAIERELGFRRRVYPKSVADGKMKQAEADHQIAVMEAILKDYAA